MKPTESKTDAVFRQHQEAMLAAARYRPTRLERFNRWAWPDCSVCAGYRGLALGVVLGGAAGALLSNFIG